MTTSTTAVPPGRQADRRDSYASSPLLSCSRPRSDRRARHPLIAARFELNGKLLAAGLHDAATFHHMHIVGHDVIEQTLVVRDQNDRIVLIRKLIDTARHNTQRVDVESGVG